jgi:hypothetical protein
MVEIAKTTRRRANPKQGAHQVCYSSIEHVCDPYNADLPTSASSQYNLPPEQFPSQQLLERDLALRRGWWVDPSRKNPLLQVEMGTCTQICYFDIGMRGCLTNQ